MALVGSSSSWSVLLAGEGVFDFVNDARHDGDV